MSEKEVIKKVEELGYEYKTSKQPHVFYLEKFNYDNEIVICIDTKYKLISKHYKHNYTYVSFTFEEYHLVNELLKTFKNKN